MKCIEIENGALIERYLTGNLTEGERDRLEEHLLTCENCHAQLEDLSLLQERLRDARWAVAEEEPVESQARWPWAVAAAAAALAVMVILWPRLMNWLILPDDGIERLAAVEPPPYEPSSLRVVGGRAERQFREAMVGYAEGSWAEVIPGLEAAIEIDSTLIQGQFYLGACYLLTNRPREAIESLSRAAELGPSEYDEWSYFYRAKAHLRNGDRGAARADLETVVGLEGSFRARAQELLGQLRE